MYNAEHVTEHRETKKKFLFIFYYRTISIHRHPINTLHVIYFFYKSIAQESK